MTARPGPHPAGLDRPGMLAAVTDALTVLEDGATVVIALSGGPDSTALTYLVDEARPDLAVTLVHVRHGLRDDRDDVAVVERHAAFVGAPLRIVEVEVRRRGDGLQAAARTARYDALRAEAARVGAARILVAHTADDQAETALMRLARGTGVSGLAAMRVDRDGLLRPLLSVRRSDVHRFVALEGLPVAEDPTNRDPDVRRVSVRQQVLPALHTIGPDPVGAVARLADLAAADDDALGDLAEAALTGAAVRTGEVVSLRHRDLDALPRAVRRRVWRRLLTPGDEPGHPPSSAVVADVESLPSGGQLHLEATTITNGGGWWAVAPRAHAPADPLELVVPGRTVWAPAGVAIEARTPADADGTARTGQIAFELTGAWTPPPRDPGDLVAPPGGLRERCVLALPAGIDRLRVRHREPGDRCATAAGTRRVAELFVDAKIPRPVRDRWPLVVAGDRVVWIPGVAADADLLAAGRAAPALQLAVVPAPAPTT